jgi:hypothetical protein
VANSRAKRRSRKPRGTSGGRAAAREVRSQRREQRAAAEAGRRRQTALASRTLGTVGERPPSPFGGLPVSELAIFSGFIGIVVGVVGSNGTALGVGALVCVLGVTEFTAREHFSGFRSHASLLAAIPAILVETGIALIFGVPHQAGLLLLPVVPVFGICFWLLRRTFQTARHARVTRPPGPKTRSSSSP